MSGGWFGGIIRHGIPDLGRDLVPIFTKSYRRSGILLVTRRPETPTMRSLLALLASAAPLLAGYSQPSFIDGCQSADGRYTVTAQKSEKSKDPNGPHKWTFQWKDATTGETRTFAAKGVQGGQIYGQLFLPPGGETFALWNHLIMWTEGKSEDHFAQKLPRRDDTDAWRKQTPFSKRLIIYSSKDGSILKELAVADFLAPEEWAGVVPAFNRVHWIVDYAPLSYRTSLRPAYALCRVSPDYSILEFRVVPLRTDKDKSGRTVRVSLADGRILAAGEKLDDAKLPVRPFLGPDKFPDNDNAVREGYVPSLDPVRKKGTFAVAPVPAESIPKFHPAKPIREGYAKLDTPAWVPDGKFLAFTDLATGKLYKFTEGKDVAELGRGGRGKVGPDGVWYGLVDESLVSWKLGSEKPALLLDKAPLNDIAVSTNKFAYFTLLKDPDKGRLTILDTRDGTARVAFDGEKEPSLVNPNGVALTPDGKHLYVGISSYKEKKHAGVYRFPILDDGGVDVAAGKKAKWFNAAAPDGIAVDPAGSVFVTVGNSVAIVNPEGKKIGELKIPKGSGTKLGFGGAEGRTLFLTTSSALYAFEPKAE